MEYPVILKRCVLMHDFIVYALCDPRTNQIRYIGKSELGLIRPLDYRKYNHNPVLYAWLRDMLASRQEYTIIVLAVATSVEQLSELETHWIATGRYFGWPLANKTARPRDANQDVLIPPGKRWSIAAWRRDPEVKARLKDARRKSK